MKRKWEITLLRILNDMLPFEWIHPFSKSTSVWIDHLHWTCFHPMAVRKMIYILYTWWSVLAMAWLFYAGASGLAPVVWFQVSLSPVIAMQLYNKVLFLWNEEAISAGAETFTVSCRQADCLKCLHSVLSHNDLNKDVHDYFCVNMIQPCPSCMSTLSMFPHVLRPWYNWIQMATKRGLFLEKVLAAIFWCFIEIVMFLKMIKLKSDYTERWRLCPRLC